MDIVSKSTGDPMTAAEQNQVTNEIENALSSTGQTPASGNLFQLAKAIVDYAAHGDFYTDSGAIGAYVLTALASKQSPTAYSDGMRVRFKVGNDNTGASTINVAALGVKNIKNPTGNDPAAGDLSGNVTLEYDAGNGYFIIYDVAVGGQSANTIVQNNFAINGTGVIQQRDDYTLVKDAYDFGPDRFAGMATGTLVNAGTLTQTTSANIGITGFAHKFNQVTLTGTGILFHRTRIESKDAKNFKNQKASLSCKVYHDVGTPIDYTLTVRKADAEDDFSSTTDISNDGGTSVSSATDTELKFEGISMGDCSNGVEIELKIECGAITLKDFEQTEYQFKVGSAANPFKPGHIDDVLTKCKRYFERMDYNSSSGAELIAAGFAEATTIGQVFLEYYEKRTAPAITSSPFNTFLILQGGVNQAVDSSINFDLIGKKGGRISAFTTGGLTLGEGVILSRDATDTCFIDLDSEL